MNRIAALVTGLVAATAVLLAPGLAGAQLQPHRAEYVLRLGTALNATRIGNAVQDIWQGCDGWHIRRELSVDMALTPSLKVSITSRTQGEERRDGNGFTWRTVQVANGVEREIRGTMQRSTGAYRLDMETSGDPVQTVLPPLTLMPVATMRYLVGRLLAGSEGFPMLMLGAEAAGAVLLIDVRRAPTGSADAAPPAQRNVMMPDGHSWPLTMAVTRAGQPGGKPLLSLRARLFESGVFNSVVVDAGIVTVAAHLQGLHLHETPRCPR